MSDEIREPTNLERVYRKVFDEETGLEVRVEKLEEDGEFIATFKAVLKVLRWPLGILAIAILSSLGSWLAGLLWGGP